MFLVEVGCFEAHENGENEASSGTMAPSRLGFFQLLPSSKRTSGPCANDLPIEDGKVRSSAKIPKCINTKSDPSSESSCGFWHSTPTSPTPNCQLWFVSAGVFPCVSTFSQ